MILYNFNMTKLLIAILSMLTLVSCKQKTGTASPTEINTTRSAAHVNIPGTRVFIVLPEGFMVSTTQPAIEKGESGSVQAMDLVGGNYYQNAATFSKERFEQK